MTNNKLDILREEAFKLIQEQARALRANRRYLFSFYPGGSFKDWYNNVDIVWACEIGSVNLASHDFKPSFPKSVQDMKITMIRGYRKTERTMTFEGEKVIKDSLFDDLLFGEQILFYRNYVRNRFYNDETRILKGSPSWRRIKDYPACLIPGNISFRGEYYRPENLSTKRTDEDSYPVNRYSKEIKGKYIPKFCRDDQFPGNFENDETKLNFKASLLGFYDCVTRPLWDFSGLT